MKKTWLLASLLAGPWACTSADPECPGADCADLAAAPDLATTPDLGLQQDLATAPDLSVPPEGALRWARRFGGAGTDQAFSTAVDPGGNIVLVGNFQGTIDFGGGPLTSAGDTDIFVVKLTSEGRLVWANRYGGAGDDQGYAVAIDASGNIDIVGAFDQQGDFGLGPLSPAGGYDILVAQYAPDGKAVWAKALGGTQDDAAGAVAVDGSGNLVLSGYIRGRANLGGRTLVSQGGTDVFVASYTAAGAHRWSERHGGSRDDSALAVAVDGKGDAVATGYFLGNASFGGGSFTGVGGGDVWVAKYAAADGAHRWSRAFSAARSDAGDAVAVDATGDPVVVGRFHGTLDLGAGPPLVGAGADDIFMVRLSGATGAPLWSRQYGGTGPIQVGRLVAAPGGAMVLTGAFSAEADFGGGALSGGGLFVARYDADGKSRWVRTYTGVGNQTGSGVALDKDGGVVAVGGFSDEIDVEGAPLTSAGEYDVYLLKFSP